MLPNLFIYQDLLSYLGIEPGNGTPDTDQSICTAINAACQTIYSDGPYWFRKTKGAAYYPGPQSINIGVTNGSVTLTDGSAITPRMIGCMIRINGEPGDNEIVDNLTLLAPIVQATGTVSATVYFNSYTVPSNVMSISGNVFLDSSAWELQPYFYGENQLFKQWPAFPVDPYYTLQTNLYIWLKVGVPQGYYIAPLQKQLSPNWGFRLMVWPVPNAARTVRWDQELGAPPVAVADLEIALIGTDTAPTNTIILPLGVQEDVLLPIARFKLSGNPHFLESKRPFITSEYTTAMNRLRALNPQRQRGGRVKPEVWMPH